MATHRARSIVGGTSARCSVTPIWPLIGCAAAGATLKLAVLVICGLFVSLRVPLTLTQPCAPAVSSTVSCSASHWGFWTNLPWLDFHERVTGFWPGFAYSAKRMTGVPAVT